MDKIVNLDVGGTKISTLFDTLEKIPYFTWHLRKWEKDPKTIIFVDYDYSRFLSVLNWARNELISIDSIPLEELEFFGIIAEDQAKKEAEFQIFVKKCLPIKQKNLDELSKLLKSWSNAKDRIIQLEKDLYDLDVRKRKKEWEINKEKDRIEIYERRMGKQEYQCTLCLKPFLEPSLEGIFICHRCHN